MHRGYLRTFLTLVFLAGVANLAHAVPPFGVYEEALFSPTITVLESNNDRVRLLLDMENMPPGGSVNLSQRLSGLWGEMNATGALPPHFTIYVALGISGSPSAIVDEWQTTQFTCNAFTMPDNNPNPAQVEVGAVGIFGGVRIVPITFHPVQYTNGQTTCEIMHEATISIEIDDSPGQNPLTSARPNFSVPWQKLMRSLVTNWEYIPNIQNSVASHILYIVPDAYVASMSDLIKWKERRGFKVTVVNESSIGGNPNATAIRNRIIQELQTSSPRIDYVTLVGDESQLQVQMQFTPDPTTRFNTEHFQGEYTNEGYFWELEGTDYFPDLFVGRWIVNSVAEVLNVVGRTILHERDTFVNDSLRFRHAVTAADLQHPSQRQTKQRTKQMLLDEGFQAIDTLWGDDQGATPMIEWIDEGVAFVNYRGTGWNFGWAGIGFYINNIWELSNSRRLPIVTGIGCGVGKFDEQDGWGFGENFMLQGTVQVPGGSVGFIGPCWNTHTAFNDVLDSSLYRSFLDYDVLNLMPALVGGKMQQWAIFDEWREDTGVQEVVKTSLRQYLVLSDPSLQVFTQIPVRLQVGVPQVVPDGDTQVNVTVGNMASVPAESLNVTVWLGAGQFATGWLNHASNTVSVPVNTTGLDSVWVTITGDNALAYTTSLIVGEPEPYITHESSTIEDTPVGNDDGHFNPGETINWIEVVRNIGPLDAVNGAATVSTTTPGVTVTQNATTFGTIAAGQQATGAAPFVVQLSTNFAPGRTAAFSVTYTADNSPPRTSAVSFDIQVPNMALAAAYVNDGAEQTLQRNEIADFHVRLHNSGNALIAAGTYSLTCPDVNLFILSGTAEVPALTPGQFYEFPENSFRILCVPTAPFDQDVQLTLSATIGMGTYEYETEFVIPLTIAQRGPTDPSTDTQSFYWLYDNSDQIYTERPEYQWIEIAPAAGGPGTVLPIDAQQDIAVVDVPFSFNYYGQTFTQVAVAPQGYLVPGNVATARWINSDFPEGLDGNPGMIAALWDNLYRAQGETGQICSHFDVATDRFIVEWYQIHQASYPQFETFQIQLLNPATYPTQSGNAEWMFQYDSLSVRALAPTQGASVGFESPDEQSWLNYFDRGSYRTGAATLRSRVALKITTELPVVLRSDPREIEIPTEIALAQNYPNPFNPETNIEFALPAQMDVRLEVFDVLGRSVAVLADGVYAAGTHRVNWAALSDQGGRVTSGIYFYRLSTSQAVVTKKMLVMK